MKAGKNRGLTAPPKSLVATGELKCDCISTKDDRANKTKRISTPECLSKEYVIERNLSFDQLKIFSKNYKSIRAWLWFVYKINKNNGHPKLFANIIQTRKTYPTVLEKKQIL